MSGQNEVIYDLYAAIKVLELLPPVNTCMQHHGLSRNVYTAV